MYLEIPRILDLENVICIITKNLVNVAMRSDAWFYNIFMYLYNKNILKYAKILITSGRFMIFHIEGYSTTAKGCKRKNVCVSTGTRTRAIT